MLVRFLAAVAAVLFPLSVFADTLVFPNGDRLSGSFLKEEDGLVHFTSDTVGPVVVLAGAALVERTPEVEVVPEPTKADTAGKQPKFVRDFKPLDLRAAARNPARAKDATPVAWQRKLEFGFSGQRNGADRTDLALRFELARRGDSSETRLQLRHLYGETDDVRTADNSSANLRVRKNLSDVMFGQSATRYDRDALKGIDHEVEQGFGVGRNLFDRDDLVLAFGAGAAARNRRVTTESEGWSFVVDAFQDLSYEINDHLSLTQDIAMIVAPMRTDDYKLRLNAALSSQLTPTMELSMRYELEYNRAVIEAERESQRFVTSIGFVF